MKVLRTLKPWQIFILVVVVLGAAGGAYTVYNLSTPSTTVELEEDQQVVPVQRGDLVNEISISGSVSFPGRESLTFGSSGIIEEINVEEGERVVEGQVLARLDSEAIAGLEKAAAQSRVTLRDAEESLEDYKEPPSELQIAEARLTLTSAENVRDSASESLEKLLNPTVLEIESARSRISVLALQLSDAEDRLAELLEGASELEHDQATAAVDSARLSLLDAEDELAELLEPPAEVEIARAESTIEGARLSLETLEDQLADMLQPATDLGITEASTQVDGFRIALQQAEEDLAEVLEPASDASVAQAKLAVAQAELAVQVAEEELASLLEPESDSAIGRAKDAVLRAELAVQRAEEALEESLAGPSEVDVTDARDAIESATSEIRLLEQELAVLVREWQDRMNATEDSKVEAAEAYALEFREWLGVSLDPETLDPDPEVALAQMGVDLESMFDPSSRSTENPYLQASEEGFPSDDPATAWNEFTVYLWTTLSLAEIVGVCDPGDVPHDGFCVQEEFRSAGAAYQTAIDSIESTRVDADRTIAAKRAAILREEEALKAAQERLADLLEPIDPLVIAENTANIELAKIQLAEARESLADLRLAADPLVVEDMNVRIDVSKAALGGAQEALAELLEPPDPIIVAEMKIHIEVARVTLANAQESLAELVGPPDPLLIRNLEIDIEAASVSLLETQEALKDLTEAPDTHVVDSARHRIALAKLDVRDAEEKLADLGKDPDAAAVTEQRSQIDLAQANLDQSQTDLEELLSGEDREGYATANQDVEAARLAVEKRREELDEVSAHEVDAVELAFLKASIVEASALVEEADRRLADAVLRAPWDGFVSQVNVEQGQRIEANSSVLELVDTTLIEIDGSVDEIDVLSVTLGSLATVTMDALPGETVAGVISFLGAEAQGQQGIVSYPISVQLEVPQGVQLPEGLSAVADITISEQIGVLLVPIQALRGSFDQPTLQVMRGDEVVETPVTLGNSDDFWTIVTEGVEEGDWIVTAAIDDEGGFGGFGNSPRGRATFRRVSR